MVSLKSRYSTIQKFQNFITLTAKSPPLDTHSLMSWALLEKPPVVQLLKNFQTFYGTRRFITVFTSALHWSPSWARSIQSISLRSTLIFSTHLRLGLPSGLLPSGFHTNILYAFLFSPIRATFHAHRLLVDLIILIMLAEEYKLWSFLQPPVTSSLFGPNMLLNTLASNTLSWTLLQSNLNSLLQNPYSSEPFQYYYAIYEDYRSS
jgi:hypothetical protein